MEKTGSLICGSLMAMLVAATAFAGTVSMPVSAPADSQGRNVQGQKQGKDAMAEYRNARQQRWKKVQNESAKRKGQTAVGDQERPAAKEQIDPEGRRF